MKIITNGFVTSKTGHLGFVGICALLLTGGVYAKVAVDQFGDQQDEFCNTFNRPSQFYLWAEAKRQKPDATLPMTPVESKIVPARPATNGPVLP
jgi:hypothetical protein